MIIILTLLGGYDIGSQGFVSRKYAGRYHPLQSGLFIVSHIQSFHIIGPIVLYFVALFLPVDTMYYFSFSTVKGMQAYIAITRLPPVS